MYATFNDVSYLVPGPLAVFCAIVGYRLDRVVYRPTVGSLRRSVRRSCVLWWVVVALAVVDRSRRVRGTWWLRPLVLVIVAATAAALVLTVGVPPIEDVRAWVAAAGWVGPVVYAALVAALVLVSAPVLVFIIAAGLLFGLPTGLAVVMAGSVTGASVAFGLVRLLGRGAVARVDSDRLRRLDALLRRRGLLAVIGIRLVPLLPGTAVNVACGLSAVRARDYVLGTALGSLPKAAAYVAIGAFGTTPGSTPFLLAVAGLAGTAIATAVVVRRARGDSRDATSDHQGEESG
ncbi:MAG: TVP38/TMEM64 family protein [Pseudonocardiaceae bacterium]